MDRQRSHRLRRGTALALAIGLVFTATGTQTAFAKKTKRKTTKVRKTTKKPVATTKKATPATTAKPQAAASKGTVKVGVIGTSISATTGVKTAEETRKIAQAWEKRINTAGGINGYKVDVTYKDNSADPAKTVSVAKELDKAGVHVIAGQTIFAQMATVMGYFEEKKIPVIGGTPWFKESQTSPMFFPVNSNYNTGVFGIVSSAAHAGATHFRKLYCTEVAACAGSAPPMKKAAEILKINYSQQAASLFKTDYTAECLSAKSAGVDFFQIDGVQLAPVVRDCGRQNYHPIYGNGGGSGQSLLDNSQGERYTNKTDELGVDANWPELSGFRSLLATTDIDKASLTQTSLQTYEGLQMVGAVLKRMSVANPTRADFLNAVYTVKGENLDGLLKPGGVDYTVQKQPGSHVSNDCWVEFIIQDGKFVATNSKGQPAKSALDSWSCGSNFYDSKGMPIYDF